LQGDLFHDAVHGGAKLIENMDGIKRRFGRNAIGLWAAGGRGHPTWGMCQQNLSQR
jgi:hypothetical protein